MSEVICQECNEQMYVDLTHGYSETLVGYFSPPGHTHDDNCRKAPATCSNGHTLSVSIIRSCPNEDCDWTGKTECFCCPDGKLESWPTK